MLHRAGSALLLLLSACATLEQHSGEWEEPRPGFAKLARECGYDFIIGVRSVAHKVVVIGLPLPQEPSGSRMLLATRSCSHGRGARQRVDGSCNSPMRRSISTTPLTCMR